MKTHAGSVAGRFLGKLTIYVLVIGGAVIICMPLLWMFRTALSSTGQVGSGGFDWLYDWSDLNWDNFRAALTQPNFPFLRFALNTVTVTFFVLVGTVASSAIVAYAFARLRFRGRNALFVLVLATMMIPYQVTLIPRFLLFSWAGWIDTLLPLIVPAFLGGGAFNIFLLRQFFSTIPQETLDAARIDGCGFFGSFWHIVIPNSLPALGVVAIFTMIGTWNDFLGPLVYLNTKENYTLSLGLAMFNFGPQGANVPLLMAASLVVLLPCLIIFFVCQRLFIQGIVITGVK